MKHVIFPLAVSAAALAATGASAQSDCQTETAKAELTDTEAAELYGCIESQLLETYRQSGVAEAEAFRDYAHVNTNTFVSATHGGRFVQHYVNETGHDAYVQWEDIGEDGMPVGSILAKESFNVTGEGAVVPGPLFLMEKVAEGELPDLDGWKYTLISPNGDVVGASGTDSGEQVTFCHDCHVGVIEDQDAMFFPAEEYRVEAE